MLQVLKQAFREFFAWMSTQAEIQRLTKELTRREHYILCLRTIVSQDKETIQLLQMELVESEDSAEEQQNFINLLLRDNDELDKRCEELGAENLILFDQSLDRELANFSAIYDAWTC